MPIKKSLFLFGLLPLTVFAQGDNPIITVYSTQDYPIIHAELASHVYLLDQVEQWENQMSQQLSANPNIAIQQAMQIFQSTAWKPAEERLKQSYQGIISGWQNGIKKVPAILFQYPGAENLVIYGETNVDKAIKLLTSWQQKNKERD
jgi:integrating conjugative element protein (TIGR03757 family)